MKPPMSRSLHQWKRLQLPTHDQRLHQSLLRNLFLHSPRYRRSLARSPAILSIVAIPGGVLLVLFCHREIAAPGDQNRGHPGINHIAFIQIFRKFPGNGR